MRRLTGVAAAVALAAPAALALTGTVVDETGAPIAAARVCYIVVGRDTLCVETDRDGRFELIDSRLDTLRIEADGYLPDVRPAVEQEEPMMLRAAAELMLRLTDGQGGAAIARGEVHLIFPGGEQEGPFPAGAAGVLIRTLEPQRVRVVASAEGYRPKTVVVELAGGRRDERVIDLDRLAPERSREN